MNWTARINRIVGVRYPIREGACANEKQEMLRLRINRMDKIKRELSGRSEAEQREIIERYEAAEGIITLNPN